MRIPQSARLGVLTFLVLSLSACEAGTAPSPEPGESTAAAAAAAPTGPPPPPRQPTLEDTGIVPAVLHRGAERWSVVDDVALGSPAERADIEPGWVIGAIEPGKRPGALRIAFARLEGEKERAAAQNKLPTREMQTIELGTPKPAPAFEAGAWSRDSGSLHVKLASLADSAGVDHALASIREKSHKALLLDLRRSAGGVAADARRIADALRGHGTPVIVLVGPGTRGGAEALAAELRGRPGVRLIGRATAGDVDAPKISGRGVEPDETVFATLEDIRRLDDPALELAERELRRMRG